MPFISTAAAPRFDMHGASFIGLASPSRGASENAVWLVCLEPGTPAVAHSLSREEIFVGLEGCASARVAGEACEITPGSALVVPVGARLEISNPHDVPFRAVAVLPVGGQARVADGAPFTPPWAV